MLNIIDLNFLDNANAIAAFLLETDLGPILIETGPHSTLPALEKGIQAQGYQLKDIQHVFLTHIHFDHAGAAWYFARQGAQIYLHPFGKKHLGNPEKLYGSAKRIYGDMMEKLWGEMHPIPDAQLHTVEHGNGIMLGDTVFRAWHTPGHAVHHIAWQVGTALFAGDVAGVKIGDGPVIPPCPPPDINIEDWQASIALIKTLDLNKVFLTHYGAVSDIENHLNDLDKTLVRWSNWMKPHFEQGTDPKEITPLFQKMVQEELVKSGVAKNDLPSYEAANPSWMSVAGLLRYWKKKT